MNQQEKRTTEKEEFRLPFSSIEVVGKIIEAYALRGRKPMKLDDVAASVGMDRTLVSANNAFLASVGIIEGGTTKTVTEKGSKLGVALSHGDEEEIARCWRAVLEDVNFFDKILSAVRIRRGMTKDALISHIAITAGKPKSSAVLTGGRTVIDVLTRARLVTEKDGMIVSETEPSSVSDLADLTATGQRRAETKEIAKPTASERTQPLYQRSYPVNSMNITININVTEQNIGEVLRALEDFMEIQRQGRQRG